MIKNMTNKKRFLRWIPFLVIGIMLTAVHGLFAQPVESPEQVSGLLENGVTKLEQNRPDEALSDFLTGLKTVRGGQDKTLESRLLFYSGLALQQKALNIGNDQEKKDLLLKAAGYYNRMLQIKPESGAALNNLAQIYAGMGEYDKSDHFFQQGIRTGGTRKGFYALNYAEQLQARGETSAALFYTLKAAEEQPSDLNAHKAVVKRVWQLKDSQTCLQYLWRLMKHGAVNRAEETALNALSSKDVFTDNRKEFLVVVTAALARQYYHPAGFIGSETGSRLFALRESSDLQRPINELFALHEETAPGKFDSWWWNRRRPVLPSPVSGREAFRRLAHSLAKRWRVAPGQQAIKAAERYYNIAIGFGSHDADPESFLELADLYVNTGRVEKLAELSHRYETSLYRGKADGYQEKNWANIYKFHSALGFVYAHLGQWENTDPYYASAVFQLKHALTAAQNHNYEAASVGTKTTINIPAQIPALLSKAYFETGHFEKGVNTAVKYAETFLKDGRPDKAKETLEYLETYQAPVGVQKNLKTRYDNLVRQLPGIEPLTLKIAPPRTLMLKYPYQRGEDVRKLQKALSNQGIRLKPDGIFGKDSAQALKTYQQNQGLPATGRTDTTTLKSLGVE
ncbi:peptidoglycan-binding domain-containing protein [Desulfobacula sp.]|uniref:peptidoglycan-binding domain-containing protein n=1 Tax=Desulfobacula sp. TaxID=2593537 RepID=UPI0026243A65|nr:peptidoglycan-binding domain-containing protein [Desulfobacula sp.]